MSFDQLFQFLCCSPALESKSLEGQRLRQIAGYIADTGFQVVKCESIAEAELAVRAEATIGCVLLEWDGQQPGQAAGS
jgi:ornithine decarboxylase